MEKNDDKRVCDFLDAGTGRCTLTERELCVWIEQERKGAKRHEDAANRR